MCKHIVVESRFIYEL